MNAVKRATSYQINRTSSMTDEQLLIELLAKYEREVNADRRREIAGQILELVDTYFRRSLRPFLAKQFGRSIVGTSGRDNGVCQYTEMVQDFFTKVLEMKHDAFWKAQTATELRKWASVVITNQMRDFLRREQRRLEILKDHEHEIKPLVMQRKGYYEERYHTSFAEFLELQETWNRGSDRDVQLARIARHRYIDGMTWTQIATDLDMTDDQLTRLRDDLARRLQKRNAD